MKEGERTGGEEEKGKRKEGTQRKKCREKKIQAKEVEEEEKEEANRERITNLPCQSDHLVVPLVRVIIKMSPLDRKVVPTCQSQPQNLLVQR